MENRELVEPPEDDVETSSSFCGSCSPSTEDIAIAVIHEEKVEVEVEVEMVESPEEQDVESIQFVRDITDELISEVLVHVDHE